MKGIILILALLLFAVPVQAKVHYGNFGITDALEVDTINEYDTDEGVTVDGVLVKDGEIGIIRGKAWDILEDYDQGDTVTSSNSVWISLQNSNVGNAVSEGVYWTEVSGAGGGISHATSDGNQYASIDGAWARTDYDGLLNQPTIVDWTADQGATDIHSGNYTDTNTQLSDGEVGAFGYIKTYTETDPVYAAWNKDYGDLINPPTIVDWTLTTQGTIHSTNYVDNDTQLSDGDIGTFGYIKDIVEDTTPQLGASLDIQAFDIEGVDVTEFGYLDGVTEDIQTALDTISDDQTATEVNTNTASFNNNLSGADTTVQLALDTLDNMTVSGTDADAIHDNVDDEFVTATLKATPEGSDRILIEDNTGGIYSKKYITVGTLPTGGGGEANTASSSGTGISVYNTKAGIDLEFNDIKSENNLLGVALDAVSHDVELTIVEANFTLSNIGGSVVDSQVPDDITITEVDPNALLTAGADNVKDSHIDFGTGATQVSAVDIVIADVGVIITATEVEAALQENRTAIDLNTAKVTYNSTDSTKVGFITVIQPVDLDTMESDIAANNSKVTNATHTGDATGDTALTLGNSAISGKTVVTAIGTDYVLIGDTSDTGNLKRALISDFASAGGDMAAATYDPSSIAEQLVGLTSTQTLTNKTLTSPNLNEAVAVTSTATELNLLDGITSLSGSNTGDQTLPTQASLSVDHLITLSGVAEGSDDLGTFTGSTITDSSTNKVALQALETAVEAATGTTNLTNTPAASALDVHSSSGTDTTLPAATASLAGVMTGADKTNLDNQSNTNTGDQTTIAGITGTTAEFNAALSDADFTTGGGTATGTNTGDQTQADLSVDDLITLSGVADGATNLGTFTGSTITDSSTNKVALQELETALEASSGSPGGLTTQVQYNDSGAFAGDAGMTYNAATDSLTVLGAVEAATFGTSASDTNRYHLIWNTGDPTGVTCDASTDGSFAFNRTTSEYVHCNGATWAAWPGTSGIDWETASQGTIHATNYVDNNTQLSDAEVKTAYENNANSNEFSDAEQTLLGNQSNTNTGDQTTIVGITGTTAEFNTALSDGSFATGGGTATGSNTGDELTVDELAAINGAATPTSGNVFATMADVGSSPIFYAVDYGAVFDGVTDDTAEIQAAITAAGVSRGVVEMPSGTARISTALVMLSDVTLRGQGRNATILETTISTGSLAGGAIISDGNLAIDSVKLIGFGIQGHGETETAGSGVYFGHDSAKRNMIFEDLHIQDFPEYGIYIARPIISRIVNNRVSDAGIDGIHINGGTSTMIEGNHLASCIRSGIYLDTHTYGVMSNNAAEYNTVGYYLDTSRNIVMTANGGEEASRADGGTLGYVAHYTLDNTDNITINGNYSNGFVSLSGTPGYHYYIANALQTSMNEVRATADATDAPTNTVMLTGTNFIVAKNVLFEGSTGSGMSGSFDIILDEVATDLSGKEDVLVCTTDQIKKWSAGAWICAADAGSSGDVTYENLDTNGDVGTGSGQVAIGDHNHSGTYEPADATILKDADIGSTVADVKADTNTIAWSFNADELAAAITAPAGHMMMEVPVGVDWTTAELQCDGTSTGLVISIGASTTPYGTYTAYTGTAGPTQGAVTITSWIDPVAGTNVGTWVSTASTGTATSCRLITTLTNN